MDHSAYVLRVALSRPRLWSSLLADLLTAVLIPPTLVHPWVTRAIIGWNVGAVVYLLLAAKMMFWSSHERMRTRAVTQDDGKFLVLMLVVTAPWFVAMQLRFDGFLHYFFVVQHFQRFAATGFNNVQPWWFYPAVLVLCSFPLVLWLRGTCVRGYFTHQDTQGALRMLMGLTVLCVLLFFSLPKSKLLGYILPAVPALAWWIADASTRTQESLARTRRWYVSLGASALLGLTAVIGLSVVKGHSSKPIGVALRAHYQAGQPVYILKDYLYSVPFYARLQQPVFDVDDWSDPDIAQRDTWRKEIADAGSFAPALAKHLLIYPQALPAALCGGGVAWVLGDADSIKDYPFLTQAHTLYADRQQTLWRVDPRQSAQSAALGCTRPTQ